VVIVDSTVWIDYLNEVETPETRWLDSQLDQQRLGLLDLMLCEVLQGIDSDAVPTYSAAFRIAAPGRPACRSSPAQGQALPAAGISPRYPHLWA
jgi:hypothetical protein